MRRNGSATGNRSWSRRHPGRLASFPVHGAPSVRGSVTEPDAPDEAVEGHGAERPTVPAAGRVVPDEVDGTGRDRGPGRIRLALRRADPLHEKPSGPLRVPEYDDVPAGGSSPPIVRRVHQEPVARAQCREHRFVLDDYTTTSPFAQQRPCLRGLLLPGRALSPRQRYPSSRILPVMSAFSRFRDGVLRAQDAIRPPTTVYAHCDIPCGIY